MNSEWYDSPWFYGGINYPDEATKQQQQLIMEYIDVCYRNNPFNIEMNGQIPQDFHFNNNPHTLHGNFVLDLSTAHNTYEPIDVTTLNETQENNIVIQNKTNNKIEQPEIPGQCLRTTCTAAINYRGYCKDHGGVRKCSVPRCQRGSQGKNLCITHGGGKRCKVRECEKSAQSHGLCKAHGGGARCQVPNCDKSSQGGGLCRKHGGGRRCEHPGCKSGAQRDNRCAKHGGSRLCKEVNCSRTDRGGGLCEIHRKDSVCLEIGCNRLGLEEFHGLCLTHRKKPLQHL